MSQEVTTPLAHAAPPAKNHGWGFRTWGCQNPWRAEPEGGEQGSLVAVCQSRDQRNLGAHTTGHPRIADLARGELCQQDPRLPEA